MDKAQYFKSKRHIRRIVAREKSRLQFLNISDRQNQMTQKTIVNNSVEHTSVDELFDNGASNCDKSRSPHFTFENTSQCFTVGPTTGRPTISFSAPSTSTMCTENNLENCKLNFEDKVKNWFLTYRHILTQTCMNELLSLLREEGYNFPKDVRTLIRVPESEIIETSGGEYCHIGIEKNIKNLLENYSYKTEFSGNIINVSINIDGLPLCKSSTSQFWPILMSIDSKDLTINKPFMVGLYHGFNKPNSLEFLDSFIDE